MSFGVHSSSTLTGASVNTTYADVISGLTESHLNSCTSDTNCTNSNLVVGTNRYYWKLDDTNGDDDWDLIITDVKSIIPTASELTYNPVIGGMNSLNSITDANSSHINNYDCNFFGNNNDNCFAIGYKHSIIKDPKEITEGNFIKFGKKINKNFRAGAFINFGNNKKTPSNLELSDKSPLIGSMLVWNKKNNGLGLQLKYANAFKAMNAQIIRNAGTYSERGTGNTTANAYSNLIEASYKFSKNKINFKPYFSTRHAIKEQNGYTEVGNITPLTMNNIKDKSLTALFGSKFDTNIFDNVNISTNIGFEYDIQHSINQLAPTGMTGLPTVDLDTDYQHIRPAISLGLEIKLAANTKLSTTYHHKSLPYDDMTDTSMYFSISNAQ